LLLFIEKITFCISSRVTPACIPAIQEEENFFLLNFFFRF